MHELILFDFKNDNNDFNKGNKNSNNKNNKNNKSNNLDSMNMNLIIYIKIKIFDMYKYISVLLKNIINILKKLLKKQNIDAIKPEPVIIRVNHEINMAIFKIAYTLEDFKKLGAIKIQKIIVDLLNQKINEDEQQDVDLLRYVYVAPDMIEIENIIERFAQQSKNTENIGHNLLKKLNSTIYFSFLEKICRLLCSRQSLSLENANVAVVLDSSHNPDIIPEKILTMLKSLNLVIDDIENKDIESFCKKCMEELGLCVSVHHDIKTVERDCDIVINFAQAERFKNFMPSNPSASIVNISNDKTLRIKTANIIVNDLIYFLPGKLKTQLQQNTNVLAIYEESDIALALIYTALSNKECINQNKIADVFESLKISYLLDAKVGYVKKKISCGAFFLHEPYYSKN